MLSLTTAMATSEKNALDHMFLLWGGINTKTRACSNDLFQVKLSPTKKGNKRSLSGVKNSIDFCVGILMKITLHVNVPHPSMIHSTPLLRLLLIRIINSFGNRHFLQSALK